MSLSQERKKKMKIAGKKLGIAASLFAASMMLCVAPADAKTIKAKSLKLTKKSVSVTVGKTVKLKSKVKVKPAKAKLKWSSNKKKIATVTSKGVVMGHFEDFVIGQWGGIDLTVDPYTQAANGKVRLVINAYFDAKPRRTGSFQKAILK